MAAPTDLVDLGHGRGLGREAMARSIWRADTALGVLSIQSAYRDYNEQMKAYLAYKRYQAGGPWAPLAIHPDYSWHCKGLAIDTSFRPTVKLHDYGFRFEVKGEPWHGQYYTSLDKFYGQTSGGGSNPFPLPEDDMTPEQAAQLNAVTAQVAEIRQILYDAGLGTIQVNTGETHQAIFTTPAQPGGWAGVAYQLDQILKKLP